MLMQQLAFSFWVMTMSVEIILNQIRTLSNAYKLFLNNLNYCSVFHNYVTTHWNPADYFINMFSQYWPGPLFNTTEQGNRALYGAGL